MFYCYRDTKAEKIARADKMPNLDIVVKDTAEIICNECAAKPEYNGKHTINVKDFMN